MRAVTISRILFFLTAITLLGACAVSSGKIAQQEAIPELYAKNGLALEGYDAVAYFTGGTPAKGSVRYSLNWNGGEWRFDSLEHLELFRASPEKYAPQFGGYCAYAVSRGTSASGDPRQWAIVEGKLYVNNNPLAMHLWDQDRPAHISAATTNWPLIPKKPN